MVCLEDWDEMPAAKEEIHDALDERVQIHTRRGPNRILAEHGRVVGLETVACTSVFDASGRFNPQFAKGSEAVLAADTIIMAIGQTSDLAWVRPEDGIALTPRNTINVDPKTLATSAPGVYAGGDVSFGPRNAIDAIANGKKAAQSIHAYLTGNENVDVEVSLTTRGAQIIVANTATESFEAIRQLKAVNPSQYQPDHGAAYPPGPLGHALLQVAQLIKADLGAEILFVDVGGWDTHVNQGTGSSGQLAGRLDDFGLSLAALVQDLGERMADVVVLTMSEFGRTIRENGNAGTDHGHATAMFVLGGPVRGGRVAGRWPGLAPEQRFEQRDLAVTTDFRDLFGEVVARHLGIRQLDVIFPGYDLRPERFPGVLG